MRGNVCIFLVTGGHLALVTGCLVFLFWVALVVYGGNFPSW